jgi:hypothetical protein
MQWVKALFTSRPMLARVPDNSLIVGDLGEAGQRLAASRAEDGSYAIAYSPNGKPITIDLTKLSGRQLDVSWFDPRTGKLAPIGRFARDGQKSFTPPSEGVGQDWVLLLDDAGKRFPAPGKK